MNRTHYLSFFIVIAGIAALLAGTARSQLGQFKNYVALQPTTPGTSQSGHANVSGTMKAGGFSGDGTNVSNVNAIGLSGFPATSFGRLSSTNVWSGGNTFTNPGNSFTGDGTGLTNVNAIGLSGFPATSFARLSTTNVFSGGNTFSNPGNSFAGIGSGLTAVNADLLDGLNSTAFLQAVPVPLVLSGTVGTSGLIQATNSSAASFAVGIRGTSSAPTGLTIAGYFENFSSNGTGVFGIAYDTLGSTTGVLGQVSSPIGFGVHGTGPGLGVYGLGTASGAIGVKGENQSPTSGIGLFGLAGPKLSGAFTSLVGVLGEANGAGSSGVYGFSANDGVGVFGRSSGANGAAIVGQGIGGAKAAQFNGNVEVTGEINKDYGASTHQAVPIAYGTVGSTGTIVNGSGNWTVVWNAGTSQYEITISGVSYSTNMSTIVTPIAVGAPRIGGASSVGTDLAVAFFNTSSTKVQVSFHFAVYDPQ